jgi:hypothetical protein
MIATTDLTRFLVRRQRNGRQDADDRNHDHQLDKGETLLDGTLHENSRLKVGVERPLVHCRAHATPA